MPTQAIDGQLAAATDTTTAQTQATAQAHAATDPATQQVDVMVQLVRHGLDISLRSVQVWSDLARHLGASTLGCPTNPTTVALAYDLFEKLLVAQRQVVDELVATQRQLAQQFFDSTATVSTGGGNVARR